MGQEIQEERTPLRGSTNPVFTAIVIAAAAAWLIMIYEFGHMKGVRVAARAGWIMFAAYWIANFKDRTIWVRLGWTMLALIAAKEIYDIATGQA